MSEEQDKQLEKDTDLPPFFSSWNKAYLFVITFLVVLITVFYLITNWFK